MKKFSRTVASLLAMLMIITSFAFVILAEEETSGGGESGSESAGGESSGGESGGESSEPDNSYFVNIKFTGAGSAGASVYFNDARETGEQYKGTAGANLSIRVEPNDKYEIVSATFGVSGMYMPLSNDGTGKYSYEFPTATVGTAYELSIETKLIPVSTTVDVFARSDVSRGENLPYTIAIDGAPATDFSGLMTGQSVTLTFDIAEFDLSKASAKLNGSYITLEGNSVTFTAGTENRVDFYYNVVPVKYTIKGGSAIIELTNTETNAVSHPVSGELLLFKKGALYTFTVSGTTSSEFSGIEVVGSEYTVENGVYSMTANSETNITVTMKPILVSLNVSLTVGANGGVTVNGTTVTNGTQNILAVAQGDNLVFEVNPSEGYVVDQFLINGVSEPCIDNKVAILGISGDTNIQVTFKKGGEELLPITVADIDWNASSVVIDISGGRKISSEVFLKISSESSNKTVEFRSEYGSVYIPMGTAFTGNIEQIDLRIKPLSDAELLNSIKTAIANKNVSVQYKAYYLDFGMLMPEGTQISFKFDASFSNTVLDVIKFDLATSDFAEGRIAQIKIPEDGMSPKFNYGNETVIICSKEAENSFVIESLVVNPAGGSINPLGKKDVSFGETGRYSITANTGYVIKQVLVDGVAVDIAVGFRNYTHEFQNVDKNHTISVEFELAPEAGGADDTDSPSTAGTVIVIIIIVFVALAGAAALFIVKWLQEKF